MELARGWRFACSCTRCNAEDDSTDDDVPSKNDESKVEAALARLEGELS